MDSPVVWFPQICEATCEMPRLAALDVLDSLSDEAFLKEYAARSMPFYCGWVRQRSLKRRS